MRQFNTSPSQTRQVHNNYIMLIALEANTTDMTLHVLSAHVQRDVVLQFEQSCKQQIEFAVAIRPPHDIVVQPMIHSWIQESP